jgi:hypothetical protein
MRMLLAGRTAAFFLALSYAFTTTSASWSCSESDYSMVIITISNAFVIKNDIIYTPGIDSKLITNIAHARITTISIVIA